MKVAGGLSKLEPLSVSFLKQDPELKTRAAETSHVYEGLGMFMIINEPISGTPE